MALPGVDIEAVQQEVQRQCDLLPRAETTRRALSHSRIVQAGSREEAAALSNRWAVGCVCWWLGIGWEHWGWSKAAAQVQVGWSGW